MKSKIQDIANGKFHKALGLITVPEDRVSFAVLENDIYTASFEISGAKGQAVRGYVTCEDPRISIPENIFSGKKSTVGFSYDPHGLAENFEDEGRFIIHSNEGEYVLPFTALITRKYFQTSIGNIKTLNDFTNLCKLNWNEALGVFCAPHFPNLFGKEAARCEMLYENLYTGRGNASLAMEEFLCGAGKKERCSFNTEISSRTYSCEAAAKPWDDSVTVTKTNWGMPDVGISCEGDFIRLKSSRLAMEDFDGMRARLSYTVLPSKMHAGKNTAVITIGNIYKKAKITVTARMRDGRAADDVSKERRHTIAALERDYVDFRAGALSRDEWETRSDNLLVPWMEREKEGILNRLFAAYIYIICGREDEARHLLLILSKKIVSGTTPLWAFYIFLNSYFDDAQGKREALSEVKNIYLRYPKEPMCVWILLQFDYSLERNPQRRYSMIKEYASRYSESPLFYIEAAIMLRDNPSLLHKQDIFEDRLIVWMSRRGLLNRELAYRILDLSISRKEFGAEYFRVMVRCNRILKDEYAVKTVCAYLIRMNRFGEEYFPWYSRGVSLGFRIAGLYEAYMLSYGQSDPEIPNEILKYFLKGCHLPSAKRALLYARALSQGNVPQSDKAVYTAAAQAFAASELKKIHKAGLGGNIYEELILLCRQLETSLLPLEWYSIKYDIDSCCRLLFKDEGVKGVLIQSLKEEGALPFVHDSAGSAVYNAQGGKAYVYIYETPCIVFTEDENGSRHLADKEDVSAVNMMSGEQVDLFGDEAVSGRAEGDALRAVSGIKDGDESARDMTASGRCGVSEEDSSLKDPSGMADGQADLSKIADALKRLGEMAGTNEEMLHLVLEVRESGEDVSEAESSLLDVMLFTEDFPAGHEEIFKDVYEAYETSLSLKAYAVLFARKWILDEYEPSKELMEYIEKGYTGRYLRNDTAALALLKIYLRYPEKDKDMAAEELLKGLILRGIYFPFYKTASQDIKRRYFIVDMQAVSCEYAEERKLFAEIESSGTSNIKKGAAVRRLAMREVLPGIYTAAFFPVPGQRINYYIVDEEGLAVTSGSMKIGTSKNGREKTMAEYLGDIASDRADTDKYARLAKLLDMTNVLFEAVRE